MSESKFYQVVTHATSRLKDKTGYIQGKAATISPEEEWRQEIRNILTPVKFEADLRGSIPLSKDEAFAWNTFEPLYDRALIDANITSDSKVTEVSVIPLWERLKKTIAGLERMRD